MTLQNRKYKKYCGASLAHFTLEFVPRTISMCYLKCKCQTVRIFMWLFDKICLLNGYNNINQWLMNEIACTDIFTFQIELSNSDLDPQNVTTEKTLAGRAFPCAKLRLLNHCAWNDICMACACTQEKRSWQAGRKKSHKTCIFHVGLCVERPLAGWFRSKLTCVCLSCQHGKFRYRLRGCSTVRC